MAPGGAVMESSSNIGGTECVICLEKCTVQTEGEPEKRSVLIMQCGSKSVK